MSLKALRAKLIIHGIPTMTKDERKDTAQWLEDQAKVLKHTNPLEFEPRFAARLWKKEQ